MATTAEFSYTKPGACVVSFAFVMQGGILTTRPQLSLPLYLLSNPIFTLFLLSG